MTFIELNDVIKLYETENKNVKVPALRGVELAVEKGDLIAIIGPSGSGKTTLIKMVGGIESPSSGTVRVGDLLVNDLKRRELVQYRRKTVGFMWQFPEKNLLQGLSVFDNITTPMELAHTYAREERKKRALELIEAVGLTQRKHHKSHQLSGGEAQRAALAVALANEPEVVLADEPTGELDSGNAARIIDYLRELNKSLGQTFIVVTHDQRFATMTNQTFKIRDGVLHGIHRPTQPTKGGGRNLLDREHLLTVDSFGAVRLPKEILERAGVTKLARVAYNKERNSIELFAADEHMEG